MRSFSPLSIVATRETIAAAMKEIVRAKGTSGRAGRLTAA